MYPHFANEYILLEHELGRNEFPTIQRYYRASTEPIPVDYTEKPRSISTKSSRSSMKAEEKPKHRKSAPARASESDTSTLESTLSCLATLFQGMYTSTLCRLMLE